MTQSFLSLIPGRVAKLICLGRLDNESDRLLSSFLSQRENRTNREIPPLPQSLA